MNRHIFNIAGLFALLTITGCKKFIAIDPPVTAIAAASVYTDNGTAAAVMTGIYDRMESNGSGLTDGNSSISYLIGLSADELKDYASVTSDRNLYQFYTNALSSQTNGTSNNYFWQELYNEIYAANACLEGLGKSPAVTAAMKQQLTGEAKFMRAFLHFYGTLLYGDVPLVTSTDYITNNSIRRTSQSEVFQQVVKDLTEAQQALSDVYVDAGGNPVTLRIRPNKAAATALLARVYLYMGKNDLAEAQASAVINNTQYHLQADLNKVFKASSPDEAILQFIPVVPGFNANIARFLVLTSPPGTGSFRVALSPFLINAFEVGDARRQNWVGKYTSGTNTYYYPNKYKVYLANQPVTEYFMVLRLSEQFLIRAEARAQQGNITGAADDLNVIRNRAGLPNTIAADKPALLASILHERQTELFTEWGHRWFDLNRTANINSVMGSPGNVCQSKGGNWSPDWAWLPLPYKEIVYNPNLTQNKGYQ